jgi:AcrR family transcriptional regulator
MLGKGHDRVQTGTVSVAGAPETPGSRRAQILEAALACFSDVGYAATTVDEVRRRSGASTGSMYHHFTGKEQLAAALLVEGRANYYQSWLQSLERRRTAEAGVRAAVRQHFNWMARNIALGRFVFGFEETGVKEVAADQFRSVRSQFQQQLLTWLTPHVGATQIQHLPDDVYEPLWMAPAQSFTQAWLGWDDHRALTKFHRHFADGAWAALRT